MSESWTIDKSWSDKFVPLIKNIVGPMLLSEARYEEDAFHNTDLITMEVSSVRIACRIRRHHYYARYGNQFTIRTTRPNGKDTELSKLISGWGNYFFYAFSGPEDDGSSLRKWTMIDLNLFRLWFNRFMFLNRVKMPGEKCLNRDGSSEFHAFDLDEVPEEVIFATSGDERT